MTTAVAQQGEILSKKEIKQLEDDGEIFYEKGQYEDALVYFKKLIDIKPDNPYYNLVTGICYTYDPDEKDKSLFYLNKAKELNPEFDQVDLYLGRAYYKTHRFQEAIDILNELLTKEESDDYTEQEAKTIIRYCENALVITADTIEGVHLLNMGNVINSDGDEYAPLVLPDESQLIYTYKGEKSTGGKVNEKGEPDEHGRYFEDINITFRSPDDWMYDEDIWLEPHGLDQINTDMDDACIALSIDGQMLFLYKYTKEDGGDIYYSKLEGKSWGQPKRLEGEVNTKSWEGSVSISSDGQVLYFSSDRPGGFGGRDLYRAEKLADYTWGNITNLGSSINTALHDDSPFLHLDKQTLYFSSQGHNSMGGYDVFFAVNDGSQWGNVRNMGAPVNTTEDDLFYVANADGTKGFYSSAFGDVRFGHQDIYIVTPDVGRIDLAPVAALIVGRVFANDSATGSEIHVFDLTNNKQAGVFYSNSESGDYRIALLPGSKFSIEVRVEGFEKHTDEIDLESLKEYIEVSNNIYVYSAEYAAANEIKEGQTMTSAMASAEAAEAERKAAAAAAAAAAATALAGNEKEKTKGQPGSEIPCPDMVDLSSLIGKDLNKEPNYRALIDKIGIYCADELEYRIQIGAYRFPKNFKYKHLDKFGQAQIIDYPDGITRFTIGVFTTLGDADELRQQIRKAGTKDAWVIPFYKGERIFMEELISVNFYKNAVN